MKRLKEFLVLCLMALGGCASPPPEFAPVPQENVALVVDAMQVQTELAVSVNGVVVGRVPAYGTRTLSFAPSIMREGQCISVAVHQAGGGWLRSNKQCLMQGESYFTAQIVPASKYIWLNPRR